MQYRLRRAVESGHVTLTTLLSGTIFRRQAGTYYGEPVPTQFEVTSLTRYGDIKSVKNVWVVRGRPRSSAVSPFDRAHTTS